MNIKDSSVECEFHPVLTSFLFYADQLYRTWGSELLITSGSEPCHHHSYTSLHYATPAQAADIRSWKLAGNITAEVQAANLSSLVVSFCKKMEIPSSWIEIILESNHIHIEYQPKRTRKS